MDRQSAAKKLIHEIKRDHISTKCAFKACSNPPINSHTISKSQHLGQIIDQNYTVMTFHPKHQDENMKELKPAKVGWKKASVFSGFCKEHDMMFQPLESGLIKNSKSNCILSGYRAICYEIHCKKSEFDKIKLLIEFNKTFSPDNVSAQLDEETTRGCLKSLKNLSNFYTKAINTKIYNNYKCCILEFSGRLSVFSTAFINPEFSADTKKIQDQLCIKRLGHGLSISTLYDPVNEKNYIFFSYIKNHGQMDDFIKSMQNLSGTNLKKFIIFIQFYLIENTFFSSIWWENLCHNDVELIKRIAPYGPDSSVNYEGYEKFSDNITNYDSFEWLLL